MHHASFLGVTSPACPLSFTLFGLGTMSLGQLLCSSSAVPFHCPFWGTCFSDHGRSRTLAAHSSFQSSYALVDCFEELLSTHANHPLVHSVLLTIHLSTLFCYPASRDFLQWPLSQLWSPLPKFNVTKRCASDSSCHHFLRGTSYQYSYSAQFYY